jgi:hypothetical protein
MIRSLVLPIALLAAASSCAPLLAQSAPASESASGDAVLAYPEQSLLADDDCVTYGSAPAATQVAPASSDPFVIKPILPIEGNSRYGDWFWDESAAPKPGKPVNTVDLEARIIIAFREGHETGTRGRMAGAGHKAL